MSLSRCAKRVKLLEHLDVLLLLYIMFCFKQPVVPCAFAASCRACVVGWPAAAACRICILTRLRLLWMCAAFLAAALLYFGDVDAAGAAPSQLLPQLTSKEQLEAHT